MHSQTINPAVITLEMGFEHLRLGNLDQAMMIADQLLKTNPNLHGALNLRGLIARQQGNLEQAIRMLQQATEIKPSEPIYLGNLGACYRQSHRYSEAIATCKNALKLRPDYTNALITLGCTYFATEQYQEALNPYKQAVVLNPDHALYHAYWADALRESGQIQAAIAAYENALELSPDLPYAIGNLGVTLLRIGQPERALDYCRKATQYEPNSSHNWMNLGTVHYILGEIDAAMEAYGEAYDLDEQSALLHTLIGQVWQEISDFQQAMLWFEQALAIDPDRIDTRCALAEVVLERGDVQTAIAQFQALKTQHPDHYQTYLGLSKALWDDGNAEEAIAIAHQAVALMPEDAQLKTHLAKILASAGDIEAANTANRDALKANPNCVGALFNLAQNLRSNLPDRDVQHMEHLLTTQWVNSEGKASLHFGLAHYYDGCKQYPKSATHCTQANALYLAHKQTRGWNYDPDVYKQYIDQTIQSFTPEFFQRTQGLGHPSTVPIFVVGMPRSGTTLTEQILASHPHIFGVGERNFGNRGFRRLPRIMGHTRGTSVWDVVEAIAQPHIQHGADWHLAHLNELATKVGIEHQGVRHIVDKMPDNYNLLGWLVTLFPNAKIIHCRRNVRDVAVSCWMNQFKSIRWAFDLGHIAERVNQYQRVMDHWRRTLPVPMLELDYEDTVANQSQQTARLLDFLGLDWDDSCLQFHETDRLVRTASVTQVRQPIYTRSLERWRHYEEALQPFLERLET